ncbi:hypothetical protein ADK57_01730 [Streptomyces sp. MMG1533]|uniref:hypothetical protein n=1 Tax=Streptomyces sp. MMG1533 TaxID=1415546 RepID=UPI0006AF0D23|nr:hypothetical protein [Streptomyces sp. MMG1533]KOU77614.1 hypothetical protein ADK57_01730 [Streptomyces sp. MMG1533]
MDAAIDLQHQALRQHQLLSPLTEPICNRLEMGIRCRPGPARLAAGDAPEAQEQFVAALAVPGAEPYAQEHAMAIAGFWDCEDGE